MKSEHPDQDTYGISYTFTLKTGEKRLQNSKFCVVLGNMKLNSNGNRS